MGEQLLIVNGINGETGEYFTSPITASQLADVAKGGLPDRAMLAEQQQVHFRASEPDLAPREGVDPTDLAQTGWAVVFPADVDPALIDALRPLVEHRRSQVGDERRIRILSGDQGYRAGESKLDFLLRVGASPAGPADPSSSRTTSCSSAIPTRSRSASSTTWMCSTPWVASTSRPSTPTRTTPTPW